MRPVSGKRIVAILAAGGLTLAAAACGDAPKSTPSGSGASAAAGYKACMVTDTGGIDDRSFNASAWAGLQAAKQAQGNVDPKYAPSSAEADYEPNLRGYVTQKCNFILSVGGLMGDVTKKVAAENATQQFGIVDSAVEGATNVYPMQFATEQAAFLAGYLAAGYSKSGKVATYGGLKIPPVTVFMDGFADGVAHYNKTKSKNVAVLGWDKAKQNGTFAENFGDQTKGKTITNTFVSQGADVIMPVAGGTGLGSADVAKASGGKLSVIWVDQDGCKSAEQYCDVFLTTVVKNIAGAVEQAVVDGAQGKPLTATPGYLGTLQNDGVSLAPYNQFDSKVDAGLKSEVDKLKADIIAGTIKVESANAPKK
ncbi:BMP family lipoprotein [Couchioplanes caeruleus]|uniref:BMP family ABC transporter substrate-binding protein n=2 Tax=Couchioplanes caeruleus TaxID=56438 RepID=A0A1K0H215_9ACTN|nr:BMP family ABC transporter substrate-binding protein [Couchioplanes caeruleus]OJF15739.1 BMP family ABC transporter substrate-binding protein [Couchioplanes caeruleus subsp. caeruleus]ROP31880.1 nucleoside-binding protein [Couchioplanes caeruleus]